MTTLTTTAKINRHIGSELDGNGRLVYFVEYTGDEGEQHKDIYYDHADAYAFVRDELLGPHILYR